MLNFSSKLINILLFLNTLFYRFNYIFFKSGIVNSDTFYIFLSNSVDTYIQTRTQREAVNFTVSLGFLVNF